MPPLPVSAAGAWRQRLLAMAILCCWLADRALCFQGRLPLPPISSRPLRTGSLRMQAQDAEGGAIDLLYDSECPVCM